MLVSESSRGCTISKMDVDEIIRSLWVPCAGEWHDEFRNMFCIVRVPQMHSRRTRPRRGNIHPTDDNSNNWCRLWPDSLKSNARSARAGFVDCDVRLCVWRWQGRGGSVQSKRIFGNQIMMRSLASLLRSTSRVVGDPYYGSDTEHILTRLFWNDIDRSRKRRVWPCSLDAAMDPKKYFAPDANTVCRFVMTVR